MKIKVEKKANKGSKEKINIKIGKYDSISDIFKAYRITSGILVASYL